MVRRKCLAVLYTRSVSAGSGRRCVKAKVLPPPKLKAKVRRKSASFRHSSGLASNFELLQITAVAAQVTGAPTCAMLLPHQASCAGLGKYFGVVGDQQRNAPGRADRARKRDLSR